MKAHVRQSDVTLEGELISFAFFVRRNYGYLFLRQGVVRFYLTSK